MANDLVQWAQVSPIGVGEGAGTGLTAYAEETVPALPIKYERKPRSRPNRGRKKRTNRTPGLVEPPWHLLRELGVPIPPGLTCIPTPTNWRRGDKYAAWRIQVHAMWGTTCHLCGHGGAHTADHLIPLSVWSNQPYSPHLSRPAHGVDGCPTCHVPCNSSRGNKQIAKAIGQYKPAISL
jgi:hypothetical protein